MILIAATIYHMLTMSGPGLRAVHAFYSLFLQPPHEAGIVAVPILEMKKLRPNVLK